MKKIRSDELFTLKDSLEWVPFPMALTSPEGKIVHANRAMLIAYEIADINDGYYIWSWAPSEEEAFFRKKYVKDFPEIYDLSSDDDFCFSAIDLIKGQHVQVTVTSQALFVDEEWQGYISIITFSSDINMTKVTEQKINAILGHHDLRMEVTRRDGSILFSSERPTINDSDWLTALHEGYSEIRSIFTSSDINKESYKSHEALPIIHLSSNLSHEQRKISMTEVMEKIYQTVESREPTKTAQLLIDPSFNIKEVMQADLGYDPKEIIGSSVLNFIASNFYREEMRLKLEYVFSMSDFISTQLPVFGRNGSIIWYKAIVSPTIIDGIKYALIVGHDITELLMAQEVLRESDSMLAKGQLASIVAHELNNPLAGIKNAFELLRMDCSDCPIQKKTQPYFELIHDEIIKMQQIIRQMYGLYTPGEESPVLTSPTSVAEKIVSLLKPDLIKKSLIVSIKSSSEAMANFLLPVNLLNQCLINILKNAIDASPENTEITIFIGCRSGRINYSIMDQGIGIDESKPIFEPFFTTKHDRQMGMGIGLAITKSLVTKAGGTISAGNHSAGGAVFTISLPIQSSHA